MNQENPAAKVHYKSYWTAWGILLAITLAMLAVEHPAIVLIGIVAKATIIMMWFMHLKDEFRDHATIVVTGIFGTCLIMYFLLAHDAGFM